MLCLVYSSFVHLPLDSLTEEALLPLYQLSTTGTSVGHACMICVGL